MNPAQLGTTFYDAYFEVLGRPYGSSPSLQEVCRSLYDASTRRNGTKVLQFSFATKLLHMRDQRLPIYDSMVAKFFFFEPPDPDKELSRRIEALAEFYSFLAREYERVQRELLMQRAGAPFKQRFAV